MPEPMLPALIIEEWFAQRDRCIYGNRAGWYIIGVEDLDGAVLHAMGLQIGKKIFTHILLVAASGHLDQLEILAEISTKLVPRGFDQHHQRSLLARDRLLARSCALVKRRLLLGSPIYLA